MTKTSRARLVFVCDSIDFLKRLRITRQQNRTALGHDDIVLDPDTADTWEVNPWFNGERHPDLGRHVIVGSHRREFVYFDAESVPDAMREVLAVAGRRDDLAGRDIDSSRASCRRSPSRWRLLRP